MYFLLKMVIFYCYVSLPEGTPKMDGGNHGNPNPIKIDDLGGYIALFSETSMLTSPPKKKRTIF